MSPFRAKLSTDELLDGAGKVLRAADPEQPEAVSQRAFDANRSLVSGMPKAHMACQRVELSWEVFKRVALTPSERRSRALGVATRRPAAAPDLDTVVWALRTAAQALRVQSMRPHEYAAFQREVEGRSARAWKHGREHGPLPTVDQILVAVPWEEALAAAGLDPKREHTTKRGEDPAVLLRAFVEAFGGLPADSRQLAEWAKCSGVAMARFRPRWLVIRSDLIAERKAAGLPQLSVCPRDLVVDPALGAPGAPGAAVRKRKEWTDDAIIEGLALALDQLQGKERLTQRRLNDLARGNPEIPNYSALGGRKYSLEQFKRRAEALRRVMGDTS